MAYSHALATPFSHAGNGDMHAPGPSHSQPGPPQQNGGSVRYPNPNVQGNPHVYMAVYSSVPVYEMMCRGIGVMRRRSDSYMNATQLLKVAGVEKGKRTKILERDIVQTGEYEKIQGGYGRYQGTWVPFHRAQALAEQYQISALIAPLLDYLPPPPINLPPNGAPQPFLPDATAFEANVPGRTMPRPGEGKRERDDGMAIDPALSKRARTEELAGEVAPASKPTDSSINEDPQRLEAQRQALHSLFVQQYPQNGDSLPADIDPDLSIDEDRHTALHWAAGLGRIDVARVLLSRGATASRGNALGETPLMRAVVTTNCYELDVFPTLLALLGAGLRTADDAGRTALHHAVSVAGIKGRAACARSYVECILEYIAKEQSGAFRDFIDHVDMHGNTALSVAARVGNPVLARMLLEVGADSNRANKVGLRPADFGLDGVQPAPAAPPADASAPPVLKTSQDVITQLAKMLTTLDAEHANEVKTKAESLAKARHNLREAAAQLAKSRQQLAESNARTADLTMSHQRVYNYERALREEDAYDWTGRLEIDGSPAHPSAGPAFAFLGPESLLAFNLPPLSELPPMDLDPPVPGGHAPQQVTQLRRLVSWYARTIHLMRQRIGRSEATSSELEGAYRKVVARSCRVPVNRIDSLLEQILVAIEAEGPQAMDTGRMAAVLSKVRGATEA